MFILDGMLHHCLFLTVLWLNHVCGTSYYYADEGHEEQENDQAYYEFRYGVGDHTTGDFKSQWEVRKGDKVKGEYSLLEPDGTVRTVHYSADKHHGFNAIVTKDGKATHPKHRQHHKIHNFAHSKDVSSNKLTDYLPEYLDEPEFDSKHFTDYYSPEEDSYEVVETKRKSFHAAPDVPPNHSPVYTGVSDYNKLVNMYKNFREQNSDAKKHKFDYGIDEYFQNGYEALNQRNKYQNRDLRPEVKWPGHVLNSFV